MQAPPRKSSRRRLWWAAGSVTAIAIVVAACELSGWPFLRKPLQNAMSDAAGVSVTLEGKFSTHLLWNPRLHIDRLQVAPGGGAQVPHLLAAQGVTLAWRWGDVWRWRRGEVLRVQALEAEVLDAHLVRDRDGRASWQLRPAAVAPKPDNTDVLADLPLVGLLRVGSGHIVVDDVPSQTRLTVDLRGGEGDALPDGTRAGYHGTVAGRWKALPMNLQLRTGSALPLLQNIENDSPPGTLRVEGTAGAAKIFFDGNASALLGQRQLQGQLRVSGPSLAQVGAPLNITLPQTPPFDLRGTIAHDSGVWRLQAERATIGRSQLNGDFRFDTRATPARLSGRLGGTRLALADLGPSVGAAPAGAASAPAANDRKVLPQRRFDLPSLRAMDADVQVAIAELDFGSTSVAPLKDLQTQLLLQGGVLKLQALKASVAGGQFSGSSSLDANADPARWVTDLRFAAIDLAGWVRGVNTGTEKAAARAPSNTAALKTRRNEARRGGEQPVRSYITGTLTGRLQATGRGRSTAEILSTLDGQAQVALNDGTLSHLVTELAGLDLAQALGVLISQDEPLPLRCALLDLQVKQGVVRPRRAVLDNTDSTLRLAGQVNLRDETLALQLQVKPKDFSPLAPRVPIVINGTLGAPAVGVDVKRLTGKVLGALALAAVVAPVAALLPLVDAGSREKEDPCADPGAAPVPAAAPPSRPARGRP